jgi:putative transposase
LQSYASAQEWILSVAKSTYIQSKVARLMSEAKLYGVGTYKRKPYSKAGPVHKAHPNHLHQCFISGKPNDIWVSDITYIRTQEG